MSEKEGNKCSCWARLVFAGLHLFDWVILLATVHTRCMILALHLDRSDCSAVAAEIPLQEREIQQLVSVVREVRNAICNDIVGSETQSALIPTGFLIMRKHCRRLRALYSNEFVAPLMTQTLKATLLVKSRRE